MANVPLVSWDETAPAGGEDRSLGDNRIREMKSQLREVIAVDHEMASSGQTATTGQHKQVTLQEQADLGTGAEGVPILGAQTVSGKAELVFTDEDDNDVQITSSGSINIDTSNNMLLTGNQTVAGDKTFTGETTLADGATMASSAAPDADAEIANKKYVDDTVAGTGFGTWDTSSYANNTEYTAPSDGFVHGFYTSNSTEGYNSYIYGYTGASAATTLIACNGCNTNESGSQPSVMFCVKSGEKFKVKAADSSGTVGSRTCSISFMPLS